MALFFSLVLALVSIAVLAWPILRRERSSSDPTLSPDSLEDLSRRRQHIYDEVQTLSMDHELGIIRTHEYQEDLRAYRFQAAYTLREQEHLQQALAHLEEELEDEALELRKSWGTVTKTVSCETCGGEMDSEAVICPRCALSEEAEPYEEEEGPWEEK